jgi:Zn-dependent protease with chaperone function
VAALAAALAPAAGALAALPGIALAGGAAMTVWKLSISGLADAMGAALSGNAEALSKALTEMSESGRQFILEFNDVVPVGADPRRPARARGG